jgi:hypothetical protein
MHLRRAGEGLGALIIVCVACVASAGRAQESAVPVSLKGDGSVQIAGRAASCGAVRTELDSGLPNLGISIPSRRLLVLNPALLRRQPDKVRLFVFYHECGHHHVGGNELRADCWAVGQGVREGWLGAAELGPICDSFGNRSATATHPAAAARCRSLERCFAAALAQQQRAPPAISKAGVALSRTGAKGWRARGPDLVSGPTLVRDATR